MIRTNSAHEITLKGSNKCALFRLPYVATYAYDLDGRTLRQTASWAGGGDEELLAYDAQHRIYPDASITSVDTCLRAKNP
jgi:hypothetical protein